MSEAPHRIRLSPALRALVSRISPNVSAAHRALLLLGAHAAGYDVAPCRADTARVLAEELDDLVSHAVEGLLNSRRTAVGLASYSSPTDQELYGPAIQHHSAQELDRSRLTDDSPESDPFAGIGIEV